ncbi:MAG: YfcE family phosphodiesterase [archaeon]|nr:YfcE family phosphodiesterase [archaeon]
MNPELVLVVSDMFVPQRKKDIPEQFKSVLVPNKIQHVLTLGNIGSNESYDWLKSLSNDFNSVKGEFDSKDLPEKKVIQVGEFKIGMIHGHQVFPAGNINALSSIQRELGCDILLHGFTHRFDIQCQNGNIFINPGSISGAFSTSVPCNTPSFVLMVIQGDELTLYSYLLNDSKGNFTVNKYEHKKGDNEYKMASDEAEPIPQENTGETENN